MSDIRPAVEIRPAVDIREATEADVAAITAITNLVIEESDAIWLDEPIDEADRRAWFAAQQAGGWPVLVADEGGTVVGFAAAGRFREKSGYWPTVEHTILLAPAGRNRGVGPALMAELTDRVVAAGHRVMVAACDGGNAGAIAFHQRLGFRIVGELPGVGRKHGRSVDLVLLQRDLPEPSEPTGTSEAP